MKKIYILLLSFSAITTLPFSVCSAQNSNNDTILNAYVAPPSKVANAQLTENQEIQYFLENSSIEEMAEIAIKLNQAQRREALQNGTTPPEKLSAEVLKSKEKIAEYLRSQYKFSY